MKVRGLIGFVAFALIIGGLTVGCGEESQSTKWSTNIQDAQNPLKETPLKNLEMAEVRKTLTATRAEINVSRPQGMQMLIAALVKELEKRGLDASSLSNIDDNTVTQGKPIPGASTQAADAKADGIGGQRYGLVAEKYYDCPILAEENNTGTECDDIVDAVVVQVKKDIEADKEALEETLGQQYADLAATSNQFIASWAFAAQEYGVDTAAIYAKYELKAAAQCDDKTNAGIVSIELGHEQGWQIVESYREWAIQQVDTCLVNTDQIAEQVRQMSRQDVDTFMSENKVCDDVDLSSLNQALKEAEIKRKQGINEGIDQRVEILRAELFTTRETVSCGGGDGGDGGDGGGGGEPLVIDLDGDGLQLSTERVSFDLLGDGTKQSTTWVGRSDGLVAIDLDGDGAITSVAELMGNKSDCGGHLCYDGIGALAAYDSPARGGNGDGQIDSRDRVFDRLLIWVDANHDGESQQDELSSFADHGVIAINVSNPTSYIKKMEGATLSGEIQVMTKQGFRTAYDAWFMMQVKTANLDALMPR